MRAKVSAMQRPGSIRLSPATGLNVGRDSLPIIIGVSVHIQSWSRPGGPGAGAPITPAPTREAAS
jgi:hypothetical protein